jgi:hypothetical protein
LADTSATSLEAVLDTSCNLCGGRGDLSSSRSARCSRCNRGGGGGDERKLTKGKSTKCGRPMSAVLDVTRRYDTTDKAEADYNSHPEFTSSGASLYRVGNDVYAAARDDAGELGFQKFDKIGSTFRLGPVAGQGPEPFVPLVNDRVYDSTYEAKSELDATTNNDVAKYSRIMVSIKGKHIVLSRASTGGFVLGEEKPVPPRYSAGKTLYSRPIITLGQKRAVNP